MLYPLADLTLARRLERAEANSNADFVETRARLNPASQTEWIEVAGAYAMFDSAHSPLTQTFGLGLFEPVTAVALAQIEAFFQARNAPVLHEISPLADPDTLNLLHERGYRPHELTSVMYRPISHSITSDLTLATPRNSAIQVRLVDESEYLLWAQTAAAGWSETPELSDFILGLSTVSAACRRAHAFIAELDGQAIGTGALNLSDGVALLAGASTIPAGRQQGAQAALLQSRLRYAVEQGCDLAMMCAAPGSASQRNAERQGFRIAYTRIKWMLKSETV